MHVLIHPSGTDILTTSSNGRVSGWVDQPTLRGTWDIIWTCLVTTFICTYTLLCLNVPPPTESFFVNIRRRVMWMFLAIVGPEIVLTYAAGQWSRAKHSVAAFHSSGYGNWTMRMAFFADMGGFVLQTLDSDPFPVNAKQLHWLVVNNHIEYPDIKNEEIWDKSKQDRLTRAITSFQIGYLVVQCVGRAAQRLAITALELNALAIVVCSLMSAVAWIHKPADVRTPIRITIQTNITAITGGRTWRNTPLDFVDENGPGWSMNVQPFMRMPVIPPGRLIQCIPNDRFPMNPYGWQEYCVCFATLLFTGLHVLGWNFSFPSSLERILWRISSLLLFCVTAVFWILETIASWTRLGRWTWIYLRFMDPKKLPEFEKARSERLTQQEARDPTELPLPWEFWTILPIAILYGVARLYLLVEAFLELRALDGTAYVNVEWSDFFPHI
ncbi:hypothetical protein F4781DRAFT_425097 [Annulohypoxylon bovei var. microspora]|nr:hypothetical protein F4781DRAFT_425097 [Annulohypoxylon bovei var. microspora]